VIRHLLTYVAVCDRCGKTHDGGDYVGWTDAESAHTVAFESDWRLFAGRLLCWDCWGYSEDGSLIVELPAVQS